MGVIGSDDLVVNSVPAGRHELVASKPGLPPMHKDVNVTAGGTSEVRFQMAVAAPPPPPPPTAAAEPPAAIVTPPAPAAGDNPPSLEAHKTRGSGRDGVRAAAFGTMGASVVSFALAVYFGLQVKDINSQLDPDRRFTCPMTVVPVPGSSRCGANGQLAPDLSQDRKNWDQQQLDEGNRFQNYQYVAIGAGAVLAVASGVLFYFGYMADDGSSKERGYGFRLMPVASAQGGGVLGGFTF